jgi:hypothetical protein
MQRALLSSGWGFKTAHPAPPLSNPTEVSMFGFFKADPKKKLDKEYKTLLEQAMQAQRNGDIRKYSELTELAEMKKKDLDRLWPKTQRAALGAALLLLGLDRLFVNQACDLGDGHALVVAFARELLSDAVIRSELLTQNNSVVYRLYCCDDLTADR